MSPANMWAHYDAGSCQRFHALGQNDSNCEAQQNAAGTNCCEYQGMSGGNLVRVDLICETLPTNQPQLPNERN